MAGRLPFALSLAGRRVVAVGGGSVGTRRVFKLVAADAAVTVISPQVTADLAALVDQGLVRWLKRGYLAGDLAEAWLVHTATGDPAVDAAVAAEAEFRRIWCVDATDADRASAHLMAHRSRDGLMLSAHGNGDPRRALAALAEVN